MLQTSTETLVKKDPSKLSSITVDEGKKLAVKPETYTEEQAITASLDYFGGDELAAKTWVSKYALKNSNGE